MVDEGADEVAVIVAQVDPINGVSLILPRRDALGGVLCQRCAAYLFPSEQCMVAWDDAQKAYTVRLTGRCGTCGQDGLAVLPERIAAASSCPSCGKTPLRLRDHRIARDGDDFVLQATYECEGCDSHPSVIQSLRALLRRLLRGSVTIRVGPIESTTENGPRPGG